jgi:hypothetical protein
VGGNHICGYWHALLLLLLLPLLQLVEQLVACDRTWVKLGD